MDNKELIADIEQAAKDIRSEGYQIAAGYYVKAAQALTAADAHIAALDARIEVLGTEMKRRDANEMRNCLNWGPCSRNDNNMAEPVEILAKAALGGEHGG